MNSQEQSTSNSVAEANISYEVAETEATVSSTTFDNYKVHEIAPITKDGKTIATILMNQSEKLGIYDWTSADSRKGGIKKSYTFNFKVKYLNKLKNGEMLTFTIKPYFYTDGKQTGIPCIVGWSGFPETAVFDDNTKATYMEYGVQPIKKISSSTSLVLKITDSNGTKYDDVIYDHSVISKAKKGPSLHNSSKPVTITGASGAKYSVNIYNVYLENCYDDMYDFKDADQLETVQTHPVLMYNFKVNYLKKPTKNLEVSNLTSKKTGSLLSTELTISAQSNAEDKKYYEADTGCTRFIYSNSLQLEHFVTRERYKIHSGTYAYYIDSRDVSDSFYNSTSRIRFVPEFNSDALAMTPKQLMKFNGRFVVFERSVQTRHLGTKKEGKREYSAYTSDPNYK